MSAPLALFTAPKAFAGEIDRIQRNAIGSWLRLDPQPEVVLLGSDPGVAEAAAELGVRHAPTLETTRSGTPLVSDIFDRAQAAVDAPLLAYVNADIVLFQDFVRTAARVATARDRFVMIGRRTDLDLAGELDFAPGWDEHLRSLAAARGVLHAESGIDYFVFRRGLWSNIPPFAVGRFAWDGWLVAAAHGDGAAVIDATRAVLALHQNHGYPGPPVREGEGPWHEEIRANFALSGDYPASFTIRDAGQLVTREGRIVPALTPRHVLRRVNRLRARVA